MERYLYRGVNPELHEKNDGRLAPKKAGAPFRRAMYWGGGSHWGDGSVYGESERNAVVQHQKDSSLYPTSGVSTTPFFDNATRYATHDGKYSEGYVYKIDTTLLEKYGVQYYVVSEHATKPAIPGDEEVILVARDKSPLPSEIVVEVIEIRLHNNRLDPMPGNTGGASR